MSRPRRAALYARISTTEGRQHLENQLRRLRAFAAAMEWHEAAVFTDQASGADPERPGLDRLLSAAAARDFDVVVIAALDRLTRGGPLQAFSYIDRLKAAGVELWSVTEEMFRTQGPAGTLFVAIAAYIAQAEREQIIERIRAGIDRAKAEGKHIGRRQAEFNLARAREMQQQGKSLREIAAALNVKRSTLARRIKTEP